MSKRRDMWTEQDDTILAEKIISSVVRGGTQLKAFEDAGRALNRTWMACAYRWNGVIRKRYASALESAIAIKNQAKADKRESRKNKPKYFDPEFSKAWDEVAQKDTEPVVAPSRVRAKIQSIEYTLHGLTDTELRTLYRLLDDNNIKELEGLKSEIKSIL